MRVNTQPQTQSPEPIEFFEDVIHREGKKWMWYLVKYDDKKRFDVLLSLKDNDFVIEYFDITTKKWIVRITYKANGSGTERSVLRIGGMTYGIKEELKSMKFKWNRISKAWYKEDVEVDEALDIVSRVLSMIEK